ncbi:Dinitrogenase iron-molybdenum cofactor biosynthesis protein [Solidesulfovibrio carbinoliphilus subsp. oakridgensis]|uniref:Dinitrogenase iron-molybdenum cofactor biosynthesis protein n=2 Tax=Desulfovibrionaceae TaxID=194924 RepID=G7QBN7_9BACT|nr:NifB/NifX family molybdenum-iron cluster-binding protein [Solidesulfovibrio carbinoliphilus]EHJ48900.1 Dinitrogenase iron-molybdenum cofactor biosynthesis protein [Solidesulfovibrio carbinoliphilus subsp. oakridgensis]
METYRIAIPSTLPGGMESALGAHFGHCDCYTVVDVAEGRITQVGTLPNVPHVQGGCMAPVNHLAGNGVNVLLAGGMGMRPLMGFQQVGIKVYHGGDAAVVKDAVDAFLAGGLVPFSLNQTCGGGQA